MPHVFALSDPHLSFGTPGKSMDRFGEEWIQHPTKIKTSWCSLIKPDDFVLIPGDISWAKKSAQAKADLEWLHHLPGTKIILRGNHDFWWESPKKMSEILPPSIHALQNNALALGPFVFFGSRLWETELYTCESAIDWDPRKGPLPEALSEAEKAEQESTYKRELERLQLSINQVNNFPGYIPIGLCHYPPYGLPHATSPATELFEQVRPRAVVFGHLHSVKAEAPVNWNHNSTQYHLCSCDYLGFTPKLITSA